MDQSEARSGPSTQTIIQIRSKYSDMDPDLEAGSGLDQSRLGASRGTRRWIRSTPRWIGPRYNFSMLLQPIFTYPVILLYSENIAGLKIISKLANFYCYLKKKR